MSKSAVKSGSARPGLPGLHTRMRTRRRQLRLTGAELALRAGISASYVSLIEHGAKVPDEAVAAGLARVLGDDESLYRAWARAARLGLHDLALLNRLEVIARTPAYASLVESGEELPELKPGGAAPGEPSRLTARMREVAARLEPAPPPRRSPGVVEVPLLNAGDDPGEPGSGSPPRVRDWLRLDDRLVGDAQPGELFACEVTEAAMAHLRGVAAPGDCVVLARGGTPAPDRICAVRSAGAIVLSRALLQGRTLLLLPGEGERAFSAVELPEPAAPSAAVAGSQVLLIRR